MAEKIDSLTLKNEQGQDVSYDIDLPPDAAINIDSINGMSADAMKSGIVHSLMSLSTTAGSSASPYLSVKWTATDADGITTPYNGMKIAVKIPLAGVSTAGVVLSIDGGTTYHPVAYNVNTVLTSHYPVNSVKWFVYNATQSMNCYPTASATATSVTGVWQGDSNYDSNTTITYGTLAYYLRPKVRDTVTRYKLVMLDKDNRLVPLASANVIGAYSSSTTYAKDEICYRNGKIYISLVANNKGHTPESSASYWSVTTMTPTSVPFRPDKIYWYSSTSVISAGSAIGGNTLMSNGYNVTNISVCNFANKSNSNTYVLPAYTMVYLCGTYSTSTGLFTLNGGGVAGSTAYYTTVPNGTANINLSSYFTSGKDYILVGGTYSSNDYMHLREDHPMFHFDGTNLLPYETWRTNGLDSVVSSLSGSHTVNVENIDKSASYTVYMHSADTVAELEDDVFTGCQDLGTSPYDSILTVYPSHQYMSFTASATGGFSQSRAANMTFVKNISVNNYERRIYQITADSAYYRGSTCLTGDTLVTMADRSLKRLDEIEVGDYILSFNWDTMELVPNKVIYTDKDIKKYWHEYEEWEFSDGTVIKTVHAHEFYNVEEKRFKYLSEWDYDEHTYKIDETKPYLVSHRVVEDTVNHYKITGELGTNYFANGLLTGDRYCPKNIEVK